eukprot:143630-Rhodomonas_salina.3
MAINVGPEGCARCAGRTSTSARRVVRGAQAGTPAQAGVQVRGGFQDLFMQGRYQYKFWCPPCNGYLLSTQTAILPIAEFFAGKPNLAEPVGLQQLKVARRCPIWSADAQNSCNDQLTSGYS